MRHEPPKAFQVEADDDTKLIALCRAAQTALRHEGRICGLADELLSEVEGAMSPPKPSSFCGKPWMSAADIRDQMRGMRAMEGGYNKSTYEEYKRQLPQRVAYEKERDAEFRRRGGNRMKRREAASQRRCDQLMEQICSIPARTKSGLASKCSVIPAWLEAGFDISGKTQLLRSIIDDAAAICCGLPFKVAGREPDQDLISLAARSERQLNRNGAQWHALSILQDKQTDLVRARQAVPDDLKRELSLANSRARAADRVSEKNLHALAAWPATTADGYLAKFVVARAFNLFRTKTKGGDALYASVDRDYESLTSKQAAQSSAKASHPCAQPVHH